VIGCKKRFEFGAKQPIAGARLVEKRAPRRRVSRQRIMEYR
jgi:hypothetical protein